MDNNVTEKIQKLLALAGNNPSEAEADAYNNGRTEGRNARGRRELEC